MNNLNDPRIQRLIKQVAEIDTTEDMRDTRRCRYNCPATNGAYHKGVWYCMPHWYAQRARVS